jgi:hypothetical protein
VTLDDLDLDLEKFLRQNIFVIENFFGEKYFLDSENFSGYGVSKIFRGHDEISKIKFWKKFFFWGAQIFVGRGAKPPAPCLVIPGSTKPYGSTAMSISLIAMRFRALCALLNKSGLGGQDTPGTPKIL